MTRFHHLCVSDQQTICKTLKLPLPTPDVSLDIILAQEKITPADVLVRLERSRDLKAMIAAAAIRGNVTHCPPDMRLSPKPYPKAPVASPKTTAEKVRQPTAKPIPTTTNRTHVLLAVKPNPKRPGTAARDRYNLYKIGLTESQLLERGLWRSDFRHDTQRKFITWSD